MGQIPKSYAISVAVLGIVSLILGFGVAISSWMLKAKTDDMIIIEGNISSNATFSHETDIQIFDSYWWGGFFVSTVSSLAYKRQTYSRFLNVSKVQQ